MNNLNNLESFKNKKSTLIFVDEFYHNGNMELHSHDFYEIVLVTKGFTAHKWNDTYSILTPGDLFCMKPKEYHSYFNTKDTIIFNCLFYKEVLDKNSFILNRYSGIKDILDTNLRYPFKIHLDIAQRNCLTSILRFIQEECRVPSLESEILKENFLINFLILISRFYQLNGYCTNSEYISPSIIINSIQYIEQNYSQKIKIEDLSALSKYSSDYFSKIFKSMTGVTPAMYIQFIRISRSIDLLFNTSLTVSEISVRVGIEDPNYFSRLFKKITGVSPRLYKYMAQRQI